MSTHWAREDKERVAVLLKQGYSGTQIANELGCGRNAIIGLVLRDPMLSKIGFARSKRSAADRTRQALSVTRRFIAKDIRAGDDLGNGLVAVPRDPTPRMIEAARTCLRHLPEDSQFIMMMGTHRQSHPVKMFARWAAMVEAASDPHPDQNGAGAKADRQSAEGCSILPAAPRPA